MNCSLLKPLRPFLACLAVAGVAFPAAAETKKVASVEGITEYKLDNGLRVLLFPDPSKPTVTVNATYLVGSRHEGIGEKGMAHLLEHMLFKGTPDRPNIWGSLQDHGAHFNGSTWVDRTNYYETLPAGEANLEFALALEADRMVNSKIAAEDLKTEFSVVRNEFEIGENDPSGVLSERLLSSAYIWHNYRDSTIGNKSDIERVPAESLRKFYKLFYRPDNAVLIVAGKFDPETTLKLIEKDFGSIPKPSEPLRTTYTVEPTQDGERHVTLRRVGDVAVIGAVYHIPAGTHPDLPALDVLDEVLTREPTGRLYQALVKSQLAVDISSNVFSWAEPAVVEFSAKVRSDQDPDSVLKKLLSLVENVAKTKISDAEVERAKTSLLANIDVSLRDSGTIGVALSEYAAMGDWRLLFVLRDRLKEVTAKDLTRVAGEYLIATNRTSGIFYPTKTPERSVIPDAPAIADLLAKYKGKAEMDSGEVFVATPENIESRTERTKLGEGINLALLPKKTRGQTVHLSLRLHYGSEQELTGRQTALSFLPTLMMRGTKTYKYEELKDQLDKLKTKIHLSGGGPGLLSGSIVTDREHLAAAIALLGEILEKPTFPDDQFQILSRERLARGETMIADPMMQGMNAMRKATNPWPKGTIHYVPSIAEQLELLKAVTLDEIKGLYTKLIGGSHLDIAVVGDFDPAALKSELKDTFSSWKSPAPYERVTDPYRPVDPIDTTIETPDKTNAVVAIGTTFPLKKSDPDYPGLDFANFIFGSSPKSRLLTSLRHKGGLSYGAGTQFSADDLDANASLMGFAMCAPQNGLKAFDNMIEEFRKWASNGVTAEEVKTFKDGYVKMLESDLADDSNLANELADGFESGRTFFDEAKRIKSVQELTAEQASAIVEKYLGKAPLARVRAGDFAKKKPAAAK